ncbi:MAG: DUF2332 family protein [Marmoricola sp.]
MSEATAGLAGQFRRHATRHDPLYRALLLALADDLDAGGPATRVLAEHLEDRTEQAVHLRLLAGIQRLVLRGDAAGLAPWYDDPDTARDPRDAHALLVPLLEHHADELRTALDRAPQTNEVGRSACLAIGLFEAVRRHRRRHVRLLEPGASAGLNLNVDRYRLTGPDWSWEPESPVVLDTGAAGVRPEALVVVERRGCDLAPVDGTDPEQGRYLRSFVWPGDHHRQRRLLGALEVLRAHPVVVDQAPASRWLAEQLARPVDDGVLTVVWQSITEQYWPTAESLAVRKVVAGARRGAAVAHLTMEGVRDLPEVRLDGELLARSGFHGPPLTLS